MFNEDTFQRDLKAILSQYQDRPTFLFDVSSRLTISVNIAVISTLVKQGMKGVSICVDIPHTYIKRALVGRQVDISKITFLDLVSNITSEPKDEEGNVKYLDNFFCLELIYEALLEHSGFDFMIIDNMSNMLAFFQEAEINDFMMNLFRFTSRHPDLKLFILIDSKSERMYRLLEPKADVKLNMHNM